MEYIGCVMMVLALLAAPSYPCVLVVCCQKRSKKPCVLSETKRGAHTEKHVMIYALGLPGNNIVKNRRVPRYGSSNRYD